jgi:hypothetical protein
MSKSFTTLLIIISFGFQANSQDDTSTVFYNNEIRTGIFQFFLNTFYMEYEHFISHNASYVALGGMTLKKDSYEEVFGGEGGAQFRLYSNNIIRGFNFSNTQGIYFAPFVKYRYLDVTDIDGAEFSGIWEDGPYKNVYNTVGGGVLIGAKFYILERVSIDINVGGKMQYTFTENEIVPDYAYEVFGIAYTGVSPAGNFTFGIKF